MTDLVGSPEPALAGHRTVAQIRLAETEQDARDVVAVLAKIWAHPDGHLPLPTELVWAMVHAGNYVAVAELDGTPIGAALGFRGHDALGPFLHSHIAGVLPQWQGANVGFALKQHQRSWALDNALERVAWTFDPLVARNAYFNVMKLGAQLTDYFVDFYGPMSDGINDGDETDRCLVTWWLRSDRAVAAASGDQPSYDVQALAREGASIVLRRDGAGRPKQTTASSSSHRLLQLPADGVALRQSDPALARIWREALRSVLLPAFADGWEVVGVTRDSWYLLARRGASG
jgi:predicted GNAT superfamily acetyltransferase